ncbi:porin, partial [Escherichia coli]|nr:porin [Escherichia coli]
MKKVALMGLGLMVISSAANAISFNGSAGEDYTHLGFGLGT